MTPTPDWYQADSDDADRHTPDDALMRALLQGITGSPNVEGIIADMHTARFKFMEEQCYKAWADNRRLHRVIDEISGIPCKVNHQTGPTCPRCGTRPDGSVG